MPTFKSLVTVREGMDDIEAAVEWCEQGRDRAESVDRIDLSDYAERFETKRRELVADRTEE